MLKDLITEALATRCREIYIMTTGTNWEGAPCVNWERKSYYVTLSAWQIIKSKYMDRYDCTRLVEVNEDTLIVLKDGKKKKKDQ